jgi:predicted DCC family thiol-disulfide oxidoreductase YuxK
VHHPSPAIILFDGVCNFCNGTVNFIIKQDKKGIFRFAPLQSEKGRQMLAQMGLSEKYLNSFVFIEHGKAYMKSTAGLRLYNRLPWYWKWTQIFWLVPRFIRDAVYDMVAKHRYKWFGKKEQCMLPSAEIKSRFL